MTSQFTNNFIDDDIEIIDKNTYNNINSTPPSENKPIYIITLDNKIQGYTNSYSDAKQIIHKMSNEIISKNTINPTYNISAVEKENSILITGHIKNLLISYEVNLHKISITKVNHYST